MDWLPGHRQLPSQETHRRHCFGSSIGVMNLFSLGSETTNSSSESGCISPHLVHPCVQAWKSLYPSPHVIDLTEEWELTCQWKLALSVAVLLVLLWKRHSSRIKCPQEAQFHTESMEMLFYPEPHISISRKWRNVTYPVFHSHSLSATRASCTYSFSTERKIAQRKFILICGAKEFSRKEFLFPSRSVHYPHSIAQIKYTYLIKPLAQQGNSLWIIN